ncbi:MAG: hypothetical protein MJ126_02870 [Lachnospiraceae bacterium]|nr:hypothetical protein [Lachnospiraceae bacterium]
MKVPYSKEPIDIRLMMLVCLRRFRFVLYGICIGAIIFGGVYYLFRNVINTEKEYEATAEVYLEYIEEVELANIYINQQTWESMIFYDKIGEYAAEELGRTHDPEFAAKHITATLKTDVRILSVIATADSEKEAQILANAYANAAVKFAPFFKEIDRAVVIQKANKAKVVGYDDRTWAMTFTGAIIGCIVSILLLLLYFVLDDSIHVPGTIEIRYGIPAMGITTDRMRKMDLESGEGYLGNLPKERRRRTEFYRVWLKVNYVKLTKGFKKVAVVGTSLNNDTDYVANLMYFQLKELKDKEIRALDHEEITEEERFYTAEDYSLKFLGSVNNNPEAAAEAAENDAVIVLVKASDHNGKLIERALDLLRTQEANVVGMILYDTNASLIRNYVFSPLCSSTKKLKEDIYDAVNTSNIIPK